MTEPAQGDLIVSVRDERGLGRNDEPVEIPIAPLLAESDDASSLGIYDDAGAPILSQIVRSERETSRVSIAFAATLPAGTRERLYHISRRPSESCSGGIELKTPLYADGFRHLNTGVFDLELCRGAASGETAGKWGIRHFMHCQQKLALINKGSNALGGVFGPFFTPENGFVNPPEHCIANATALEEGPVVCRYRFDIQVPPGLDPALRDATLTIYWSFFNKCNYFERTYLVSDYETTVDETRVANKITVGDEFEGGPGVLLFSRFAASPTTVYRAGDPHSAYLVSTVQRTLQEIAGQEKPHLTRYTTMLRDGMDKASYDYYWQMLSEREGLLDPDVRQRLRRELITAAHDGLRSAIVDDGLCRSPTVDVNDATQQTIFARDADSTAMLSPETGYTVVWYTSRPVHRYQIVQRASSGWVNWGTNGENEYPELPSGTTIRMAYGQFEDWSTEAERLASPLQAEIVGRVE